MSTLNLIDIKNSLVAKKTEQLADILKFSQDDYDNDVLPLVEEILIERGVSMEEINQYKEHYLDLKIRIARQPKLYRPAGFFFRAGQFVVDHFIFFFLCYVLQNILISTGKRGPELEDEYYFLAMVMYLFFYGVQVGLFQGTIGMKLFGLVVIPKEGESKASFADGMMRGFGMILNYFTLQLGHLWMLVDKKKRTLVDIISKTKIAYNQ